MCWCHKLPELHVVVKYTPGWLLKSRMRWCDCRRSGFDDERFPLTGRAGGICLDCFIPTMLSSCDWPTQTSLWKREGSRGESVIDSSSVNNRQRAIFVFGREGGWKHIWLCSPYDVFHVNYPGVSQQWKQRLYMVQLKDVFNGALWEMDTCSH